MYKLLQCRRVFLFRRRFSDYPQALDEPLFPHLLNRGRSSRLGSNEDQQSRAQCENVEDSQMARGQALDEPLFPHLLNRGRSCRLDNSRNIDQQGQDSHDIEYSGSTPVNTYPNMTDAPPYNARNDKSVDNNGIPLAHFAARRLADAQGANSSAVQFIDRRSGRLRDGGHSSLLPPPASNVFDEHAKLTRDGILWPLPVDNMMSPDPKEADTGFEDHIFLERQLQHGFPKRGPIRHFMELVCNGLSQNAFMTAKEKRKTIDWYREFFKEKEELIKNTVVEEEAAASEKLK